MPDIEQTIGYAFKNKQLLETALTHTSYANEKNSAGHNERLEFLGDAVLGFLCARELYELYPDKPEGELTRMRAAYVCEGNLAGLARKINLGEAMRLGRGEESSGGRTRPSILSDAFEAVLAAVYLDGGLMSAQNMVKNVVFKYSEIHALDDPKSVLQEKIQSTGITDIVYRLVSESGPDHQKVFTSEVLVGGEVLGRGEGRSKKLAEQEAAKIAIKGYL